MDFGKSIFERVEGAYHPFKFERVLRISRRAAHRRGYDHARISIENSEILVEVGRRMEKIPYHYAGGIQWEDLTTLPMGARRWSSEQLEESLVPARFFPKGTAISRGKRP